MSRDQYVKSVYQRSSSLPDDSNALSNIPCENSNSQIADNKNPSELSSPNQAGAKPASLIKGFSRFKYVTKPENQQSENQASKSTKVSDDSNIQKSVVCLKKSISFNGELYFEPNPENTNENVDKERNGAKALSIYPVNNGCIIYQPSYKDINV